ncbi:MAG: hypothetical protein K2P58_10245 [Hyphomonadaceae bacterium]|nr:hypothetical protein [Hyphomonadaceae bacterium]
MELVDALIEQLMANVEDAWLAAYCVSFLTMVCEAAKPKAKEGEEQPKTSALSVWISVVSLFTPLLLFFHAFLTGSGALIAIIAALGAAIIVSAVLGWAIAGLAPDVGRTLNRAAPILAIVAFGVALYVTGPSILELVNAAIAGAAR